MAGLSGGGAGAGRKGLDGTVRCGGGSGGGGGLSFHFWPTSVLGATETVTVGAGGQGGAAVTANSTNGNNGTAGGNTTFGQWLKANGGGAGNGGTATNGTAGAAGAGMNYSGAAGVAASTTGAAGTNGALSPSRVGAGGWGSGRSSSCGENLGFLALSVGPSVLPSSAFRGPRTG